MKDIGVVNGRFQVLNLKHMEYILVSQNALSEIAYRAHQSRHFAYTRDSVNDEKPLWQNLRIRSPTMSVMK
ncbi:MAG: hypothetical protein ACLUUG_12885 [Lachnospiraceae bacterium]